MLSLQELIEKDYITNIKSESDYIGTSYEITINLKRFSVYKVVLSVGNDETLDDAVELINCMVNSVDEMNRKDPDSPVKKLFGIDNKSDDDESEEVL